MLKAPAAFALLALVLPLEASANTFGNCAQQSNLELKIAACTEASRSTSYPWILRWVYRELARAVQEVSDARSYDLLEALADAVAGDLLRRFAAERVRVRVEKPAVRPGGLDGTGVHTRLILDYYGSGTGTYSVHIGKSGGSNTPGGSGAAAIEFTFVPPYNTFLDLQGQTWNVSHDNTFDADWLVNSPLQPLFGEPVESLVYPRACTTHCDPDFQLQLCTEQSDCTSGGSCAPVLSSVKTAGSIPTITPMVET